MARPAVANVKIDPFLHEKKREKSRRQNIQLRPLIWPPAFSWLAVLWRWLRSFPSRRRREDPVEQPGLSKPALYRGCGPPLWWRCCCGDGGWDLQHPDCGPARSRHWWVPAAVWWVVMLMSDQFGEGSDQWVVSLIMVILVKDQFGQGSVAQGSLWSRVSLVRNQFGVGSVWSGVSLFKD